MAIKEVNALPVPYMYPLPGTMVAAQERLLSVLDPNEPPVVDPQLMQILVTSNSSDLIMAVRGYPPRHAREWDLLHPDNYLGTVSMFYKTSSTKRTAEIDHVAVDPAHQRQGIGRLLVATAIRLGEEHNVSRIDLTSGSVKQGAQPFWAEMGFDPRETNNWRYTYTAA